MTESPRDLEGCVLADVKVEAFEQTKRGPVFTSIGALQRRRCKILIFPNDDVVAVGDRPRLYVDKVTEKGGDLIVFTEVYHDDEELLGEPTSVKISGPGTTEEPSFRLRGYPGYYLGYLDTNWHVNVGGKVLVRGTRITPGTNSHKLLTATLVAQIP
jgi:hypothetical protein